MGCILFELAMGRKAFNNDWDTHNYVVSGNTISMPLDEFFSDQCKETIANNIFLMLQCDPSHRPSAPDRLEIFTRNFESTQGQAHQGVNIQQVFHDTPRITSEQLISSLEGEDLD
jgi:hypothetical protein